jgi:hypothetical protein
MTSLSKITDLDKVVIENIPRAHTGSKRGSNFRGVSVNGKKWQVSFSFITSYLSFQNLI